ERQDHLGADGSHGPFQGNEGRRFQRAAGSFLASESSIVNVSRAAACSASFLERPRARANSSVPTVTSTSNVLEWSGPSSLTTRYRGDCRSRVWTSSWSRVFQSSPLFPSATPWS